MNLGHTIASLRLKAGIKQYDLAKSIGISPGRLSQIEGGFIKPTPKTLHRIAVVLNVKPSFILYEALKEEGEVNFTLVDKMLGLMV